MPAKRPRTRSRRIEVEESEEEEDDEAGDAEEQGLMVTCEACSEEREAEMMGKYAGYVVCPGCKKEAKAKAAAARKAAKADKRSQSDDSGDEILKEGDVDWCWDDEDEDGVRGDITDEITGAVLYENTYIHEAVWMTTKEKAKRFKVGDHCVVNIEGEGHTVVEIRKLFECERKCDEEEAPLMFEGLLCYNECQLKQVAPFFKKDSKRHAKNGFVGKTELVLCSNPYTFLLDNIIEKAYINDYILQPKSNRPRGRATMFYRYEVDVLKREVVALRSLIK